eukprot:CAMPEP_0206220926 /NCGR_PEP_ID=MMETSP0047_2-20121206/5137_1 /ASSEMBLY_ACC=CAM_ASM_000192 /TAXON_ID=195065 /ORGANISM="Chroomonas mesostigmatica_cf, Strain CCMP1168" /LENGTH=99 /DNA_ID=CAMNT_0053643617 /DNA_START=279 /DNA_END=575 /DNA_ORIENTATION=-
MPSASLSAEFHDVPHFMSHDCPVPHISSALRSDVVAAAHMSQSEPRGGKGRSLVRLVPGMLGTSSWSANAVHAATAPTADASSTMRSTAPPRIHACDGC